MALIQGAELKDKGDGWHGQPVLSIRLNEHSAREAQRSLRAGEWDDENGGQRRKECILREDGGRPFPGLRMAR